MNGSTDFNIFWPIVCAFGCMVPVSGFVLFFVILLSALRRRKTRTFSLAKRQPGAAMVSLDVKGVTPEAQIRLISLAQTALFVVTVGVAVAALLIFAPSEIVVAALGTLVNLGVALISAAAKSYLRNKSGVDVGS